MGQKPTQKHSSRSAARSGIGFEAGARHRAHMDGDFDAKPGPSAAALSSPYHSKPDAEKSVPRRNPKLVFAVIGGFLAIVALTFGMLFAGTNFLDDEPEAEMPETMQFEAAR